MMKELHRRMLQSILAAIALITSGCSDSGYTGIEGTGEKLTASGNVTAFGSIWVNGIEFDTSDATFWIDDAPTSEDAIFAGMVVHVEGSIDSTGHAKARSVSYDPLIRGPISTIDRIGSPYSEITVLGQKVIIAEDSVFDGLDINTLAVGLDITISGLITADGGIFATRVAREDTAPSLALVVGSVQDFAPEQLHLNLGTLEVDYSNAEFTNGTRDALALGQSLEIRGEVYANVLQASTIRFQDAIAERTVGARLVLEGVISAYVSLSSFQLNGLSVDASNSDIERGTTAQLGNGVRIMATGITDQDGSLEATQVQLLVPSETRFLGVVENVTPQARQLTVLGTRFTSDSLTGLEDAGSHNSRRFNIADISAGESVEIFGRKVGSQWIATRVRRIDNPEGLTGFRGPVGGIESDTHFSVMGVLIDASGAEGAELVASLAPGQWLEIEGTQTGPQAVNATRISVTTSSVCAISVAPACKGKPSARAR